MPMLKELRAGQIIFGLTLSTPTVVYWLFIIRMYFGYIGSHLTDVVVFLCGVTSLPLFVLCLIFAVLAKRNLAWLAATVINSTPTLAFVCFWAWLLLSDS